MWLIVNYMIWDITQHTCWSDYKVIGYEYIESRWIRYICLWNWSTEYQYFYEYELKPSGQSSVIWFQSPKASQTI